MRALLIAGMTLTLAAPAMAQSTSPAQKEAAAQTITVTGCVELRSQKDTFILTNPDPPREAAQTDRTGGDVDTQVRGTTGEATAPAGATAPSAEDTKWHAYRLVTVGKELDLQSHVGHRVTITGRLATEDGRSVPGMRPGVDTNPDSASDAASPDHMGTPREGRADGLDVRAEVGDIPSLDVVEVKMAGGTCEDDR